MLTIHELAALGVAMRQAQEAYTLTRRGPLRKAEAEMLQEQFDAACDEVLNPPAPVPARTAGVHTEGSGA
jgi:hypothetical protein